MFGGSFSGVHDPIYARALVLDNGAQTAAVIAVDLAEIGDTTDVRQRIQHELGIPVDHIMITASHDHSAPRGGSVTPGGLAHAATAESLVYSKTLNDKIVEAVKQAKAALQPARFGLGTGKADVNINRDQYTEERGWFMGYNPDGISDKTVWVLKFETPAGEPIAVLFNYAVHSTVVLGTGELSGDLGGAASRYVEKKLGGKAVALYSMGPAGDQNPRIMAGSGGLSTGKSSSEHGDQNVQGGQRAPAGQGGPGGPGGQNVQGAPSEQGGPGRAAGPPMQAPKDNAAAYATLDALSLILGNEVLRVAGNIAQMNSNATIAAAEKIVSCPVKQGVSQMGDMKQTQVDSMNLHLGLIRINQIALAGVSGEVVTNIYMHLKKDSPLTNTMMLTMTNDRIGYIADDAAYDTPYFEVNGTPLARGCAEPGIVNGLVELINDSY
jgi:hypothetical protein